MTREQAAEIIRKEYKCVDRDCDIERSCGKCEFMMPSKEPILQAYDMAIQALRAQADGEYISRQAVNEIVNDIRDCISVEGYWAILERLKKLPSVKPQEPCEVSEYDKDHIWYKGSQYISLRRFLEVKAEAEKEPCDDAISRQASINAIKEIAPVDTEYDCTLYDKVDIMYVLSELPSVAIPSAEPKTGHWKRISMDKYTEHAQHWYRCDRCGKENLGNTDWCPNCGAKMVKPQERSEEWS